MTRFQLWWVDIEAALMDVVDTQRRPARAARRALRRRLDAGSTYYELPNFIPEPVEISRLRRGKHIAKGSYGSHLITFHDGKGAKHGKNTR